MSEIPDNPNRELENQHPTLAQPDRSGAEAPEPGAKPDAGLAEHGLRARAREPDLAESATRAPTDATRSFDTAQGRLNYAELADRLAQTLQVLDIRIRNGEFDALPLDEALLLEMHAALSKPLFPAQAGRYRTTAVQVGAHEPPDASQVGLRMRDYMRNLAVRILHVTGEADDLLLEFLAYAEGELLSIHPFPDLNGRISRLWLTEILRRLQLPPVDVVPPDPDFRARYLAALGAADRRDWKPLMAIWRERFSQPAAVNEIPLLGCTPTPLASYLKALAVLRLVAEASVEDGGDPEATGFWRQDIFVLRTKLNTNSLRTFFVNRYRPTPIIAPWSGRAGFLEGDDAEESTRKGAEIVRKILDAKGIRFSAYQRTFKQVNEIAAIGRLNSVRDEVKRLEQAKKKRQPIDAERLKGLKAEERQFKGNLLITLRSYLPDECVQWLDACYIMSDVPMPSPLFGTGGNEGSMDFSVNHVASLMALIDIDSDLPTQAASLLLDEALFGAPTNARRDANPGFLSPGSVGGVNMSSGFEGPVSQSEWNAVLMLEGVLFIAAMAARRHGTTLPTSLSAPFFVESMKGGHGSGAESEKTRPEFWAPLWTSPASLYEIQALFSEGRITIGRRPASTALDLARALASFGVDRGIEQFQRFAFLERRGKGYFVATPLQRSVVRRNVHADQIADLDRGEWLSAVQRYARNETAPNSFRSAARRLDSALFALTQQTSRDALQAVLRHIGRIEGALSISPKSLEAVRSPTPQLSAEWAIKANDESSEFRIAAALAGLRLQDQSGHAKLHARRHMSAVGEAINKEGTRKWEPTSRLAVWGSGSLEGNLSALLHRRRLEAIALGAQGELLASQTGATLGDVAEFLDGDTDDGRIAELLAGLACVELERLDMPQGDESAVLPPAFMLLKIFFTPESVLRALQWLPKDRTLHLPAEIPARLAANDGQAALRIAWQRLRALGIKLPGRDPPQMVVANGRRWLAALCIPLTFNETARLLRGLNLEPESATEQFS
jgi:CRISPR-associated protein Csx17